jgi:hypothetical protein
MPGFIGTHRHIMTGDDRWFKEQAGVVGNAEAGYTTLVSEADPYGSSTSSSVDKGDSGTCIVTSGRAIPASRLPMRPRPGADAAKAG